MKPYFDWCYQGPELQFGIDIWVSKRGAKIEIAMFHLVILIGLFREGK